MELSNSLRGALQNGADPTILAECARSLLVMMVPFAPHLAAELWEQLQAVPSKYYEPKVGS